MIDSIFKYLSYLGIISIICGCVIALPELYYRSENLISNTGYGLFFAGIGLSLINLNPNKKFTKKEQRVFSSQKKIYLEYGVILFWVLCSLCLGVFFFSLKLISPSAPADLLSQFRDVGCGTFSLSIAFISELKQRRDRYDLFQKETQSEHNK